MSGRRMVLTGATGFIGGAVLHELAGHRAAEGRAAGPHVRVVGRRPPAGPTGGYDEWVAADLAEPASLRGTCRDADVLLHLASALGPDAARCADVNDRGTAAVMEEARRAGVGRIVHLSTAAVYGPGPHRGIEVDEVAPAPVSPASVSRLAGERHARAAGAWVLRPGLVVGRGDRWVVPALAELVRRVPARWDEGRALLSMVAVADLARLIARLAGTDTEPGTFHAGHPLPVRNADVMEVLAEHGVLPAVDVGLPWDACLDRLRATSGRIGERQFSLLARDHWYRSDRIWQLADCPPGPGPLTALADAAAWYRRLLGAPAEGEAPPA
ncbi:NAD-dependent epimerase/dehydratase family protein [Streptomyces tritici]|uniref:NAD-dependent epimerase/dehydratase family protein n=1 Tax=Streptomyces tritici TaxID=2054410 RepID=UPI003AF0E08A